MNEISRRPLSLVRFQLDGRPVPATLFALGPDVAWWEDHPVRLRLRVRKAVANGQVEVLVGQRRLAVLRNHLPVEGVLVRQLKPRPPAWRKPALITVAGVTALGVSAVLVLRIVSAIWAARVTVMAGLATLLVAWLVLKGLAGHRATCPGLHCRGCRG